MLKGSNFNFLYLYLASERRTTEQVLIHLMINKLKLLVLTELHINIQKSFRNFYSLSGGEPIVGILNFIRRYG